MSQREHNNIDFISIFAMQSILIEGVENLLINLDLKKVAQKALETASENLKRDPYSQRNHSILFVKNKLLAMCSRYVTISVLSIHKQIDELIMKCIEHLFTVDPLRNCPPVIFSSYKCIPKNQYQ